MRAARVLASLRGFYSGPGAFNISDVAFQTAPTSLIADSALLQRLQSAQQCSTSGSSSTLSACRLLFTSSAYRGVSASSFSTPSALHLAPATTVPSTPSIVHVQGYASRAGQPPKPPSGSIRGRTARGGSSHTRSSPRSDRDADAATGSAPSRYPSAEPREEGPPAPSGPLGRVATACTPITQLAAAAAAPPPRTEQLLPDGFSPDPWARQPPPRQIDLGRDALETSLELRQLVEGTGFPSEFKRLIFQQPWAEFMVAARRTFKRTSTGRVARYHVAMVVGNYDGLIGLGIADASTMHKATNDAYFKAYANIVPVPRYRGHTIYHPIDSTFHKLRLQMWPRRDGFGVSGNDVMWELCRMAGIRNITVKLSGRCRNRFHVVQAWLDAVANKQSVPHDGVEGSGVYVREQYPSRLPYKLQRGVDLP